MPMNAVDAIKPAIIMFRDGDSIVLCLITLSMYFLECLAKIRLVPSLICESQSHHAETGFHYNNIIAFMMSTAIISAFQMRIHYPMVPDQAH